MQFKLYEDGFNYDTIDAESISVALEIAKDNVDRDNYNDCDGTLWIDVLVHCIDTGEEESQTVTLHEPEPSCIEEEHDFRQSYKLFGGCKENPGVWGHGGGVIIHEVCYHCGCKRIHNTWAQRMDTGEQGLDSITYEECSFSSNELNSAFNRGNTDELCA